MPFFYPRSNRIHILSSVFILFFILTSNFSTAQSTHGVADTTPFSGGSGTSDDPYQIETVKELQMMQDYLNAYFVLTADIDAGETENWNGGLGFEPIGFFESLFNSDNEPFRGSLDGNGHVIKNLVINRPDEAGVGLFRVLGPQANISRLRFEDVNVTGGHAVGALAAQSYAYIHDTRVTGDVTGTTYVGLMTGVNANLINWSEVAGTVSAISFAGGITGGNYNEIIYSNASVSIIEIDNEEGLSSYFGGLAGFNLNARIHESFAEGEVTTSSHISGGLLGANLTLDELRRPSVISRSHASVDVQGADRTGGLAGWNDSWSVIFDSFADGTVQGAVAVGGLAGNNSVNAYISRSHAHGNASGQGSTGGLAGFSDGYIGDSYANGSVTSGQDFGSGGLVGSYTVATSKTVSPQVSGGLDPAGAPGVNYPEAARIDARSELPVSGRETAFRFTYAADELQDDETNAVIKRSYSTGEVTGDNQLGGLVGTNTQNAAIQDSYWDMESSGMTTGVGLGLNEGLIGLTTGQMSGTNAVDNMPGLIFHPDGFWQSTDGGYPVLIQPEIPSPAYAMELTGPRNLASSGTENEPFVISVVDEFGNPAPVETTTRFKFESDRDAVILQPNGEQLGEVPLQWGMSEASFFYSSDHIGLHDIQITFSEGDSALAGQSAGLTVRVNHPRAHDWRLYPDQGGNQGRTVATLTGDDFNDQMEVVLVGDGVPDIPGEILEILEGSRSMDIRFDLTGQEPGIRSLGLTDTDGTVRVLDEAFIVAEADDLVPQLWTSIQGADNLEAGSTSTVNIHYGNSGDMDLHDILLYIQIPKGLDFTINEQDFNTPELTETMASEHFDDEGELDSLVPYFETDDVIVLPLWVYQIRAGHSQTIRLEIEPNDVSITQQLSEVYGRSISAEIMALPPETNPFTLSGDFENSVPELLFLYIDTVIMDALEEENILKVPPQGMSAAKSGNLNTGSPDAGQRMSGVNEEHFNRQIITSGGCVENENYSPPDNEYVSNTRQRVFSDFRNRDVLPSGGDFARGAFLGLVATVACGSNPIGWKTCGSLALAAGADNLNTFRRVYNAYDNLGEPECDPPEDDDDYDPPVCDGCGGGGSTYGDPHIITFDGMGYGFHAVGEFILTRALDDEFEIQARMEQMRQNIRHFSINTAFAINVNGDHVVFEQSGDIGSNIVVLPDLFVNQVEQELPGDGDAGIDLPNGGSIFRRGQTVTVRWPDNRARVDVWQSNARPIVGNRALGIEISLSDQYTSRVEGLMGSNSGDRSTTFVTRDGTRLAGPLSFDDLYRTFGDSWRITQDESLFGTTTFADFSMPDEQKTIESLESHEREAAETVCRDQGINHPTLLNNCIFDVAFSGEPGFAFDSSRLIVQAPQREPEPLLAAHEGRIQITLRTAKAEGIPFSFQVPDADMTFELMDDGDASSLSDTRVLSPLDAGTYEIAMQAPSGEWELLDASCNIPDGRMEVAWDDFLVTLDLLQGESVTCSFDVMPEGLLVPFELQSPQDEDLIVVEGSGKDEVALAWESATELESADIMYTWLLDNDTAFSEPLIEAASDEDGLQSGLTLTFGEIDAFLAEEGIAMDEVFSGYWTVEASAEGLTIRAAEPHGISFQRGLVTAGSTGPETPESFKLGHNYPNPFNPVTNITFDIPYDTHVRMDVYNILGQHVQTLVNEPKTAGSYNVTFDASVMASGVYIYRLSTDDFMQSRTMTLIK